MHIMESIENKSLLINNVQNKPLSDFQLIFWQGFELHFDYDLECNFMFIQTYSYAIAALLRK